MASISEDCLLEITSILTPTTVLNKYSFCTKKLSLSSLNLFSKSHTLKRSPDLSLNFPRSRVQRCNELKLLLYLNGYVDHSSYVIAAVGLLLFFFNSESVIILWRWADWNFLIAEASFYAFNKGFQNFPHHCGYGVGLAWQEPMYKHLFHMRG